MELFSIKIRCTFQLVSTGMGTAGGYLRETQAGDCWHLHGRASLLAEFQLVRL